MTYRPEGYPIPLPQPTPVPQEDTGDMEEDTGEEEVVEERPELDEDDPNYIPETELTEEDEDELFGTGEKLDGSLDEMERTDIDDMLSLGDEDEIFGTGERKPKSKKYRRTVKRFNSQPPQTMGGIQY